MENNHGKTIAYKLTAGFGMCLILLLIAGGVALTKMSSMDDATKQLVNQSMANTTTLSSIVSDIKQYRITTLRFVLTKNSDTRENERAEMQTITQDIAQRYQDYRNSAKIQEDKDNIQQLNTYWLHYLLDANVVLSAAQSNNAAALAKALQDANGSWDPLHNQNDKMLDWNKKRAETLAVAAEDAHTQAVQMLVIILSLAVIIGAILAVSITRTVVSSMSALSEVLERVTASSNSIASSTQELASGNEDLARRTSAQAASLEETASSMEEITSLVQQSVARSKEANTLASNARTVAVTGGDVVQSAVKSMHEIEDGSKKIAEIISVIDDIAFQTNLLALNAAVEAARVGEQGRGFAVVASEVRSLAGRSATAAKEIKQLVQDSVLKVAEGTTLVNKSGEELKQIVASVENVALIVAEITASAQEQETGIQQVNKAVIQIDEITQQNAALVEEAAAASESLSVQAADLRSITTRFTGGADVAYETPRPTKLPREGARSEQATGTHGASAHRTGATSRLKLVSNDSNDIEEF